MKTVLVSLALFLSAYAANATPSVGDTAFYDGTYAGMSFQQRQTLMEFNLQNNQYRKETVTSVSGNNPQTSEEWVNASDLPTDANLQQIVANCQQNSGTPEQVSTPAGMMATCKLSLQRGGTANVAPVPFGVVKLDTVTDDGKPVTMILNSFSRGQ